MIKQSRAALVALAINRWPRPALSPVTIPSMFRSIPAPSRTSPTRTRTIRSTFRSIRASPVAASPPPAAVAVAAPVTVHRSPRRRRTALKLDCVVAFCASRYANDIWLTNNSKSVIPAGLKLRFTVQIRTAGPASSCCRSPWLQAPSSRSPTSSRARSPSAICPLKAIG